MLCYRWTDSYAPRWVDRLRRIVMGGQTPTLRDGWTKSDSSSTSPSLGIAALGQVTGATGTGAGAGAGACGGAMSVLELVQGAGARNGSGAASGHSSSAAPASKTDMVTPSNWDTDSLDWRV